MDFLLDKLTLSNFRCFDSAELELHESCTVLIASNGHGKSATLDAIAICLGQLLGPAQLKAGRDPNERVQLTGSDATTSSALPPYQSASLPIELGLTAQIDGQSASWTGQLTATDERPQWEIPRAAKAVASPATRRLGKEVSLPIFAYYGTNRTRASVIQQGPPALGRPDRAYGYQNALRAGEALTELAPWLAQCEWERTRTRGESVWGSALDAVYEASTQVLKSHGVSRVSYSMEATDLILDFGRLKEDDASGRIRPLDPGSAVIPMRLVADGYRSVLGVVADLAFRCGFLNNHLGGEAPQLTSGVVLVDEIDMHLHPSWQTQVLGDLAEAFPRIQFIVTTHSPFVLSSVDGASVRKIESVGRRSTFLAPNRSTRGVRIEILTEAASLFGAPIRASNVYSEALQDLADALQDRDLETADRIALLIEKEAQPLDDPDAVRLLSELRWRQDERIRGQDACD